MVNLRWAKDDDLEAIARIAMRCFPAAGPPDRAERIRSDARCSIGDILVAELGGRIVGGATVIPQRVWTGGCEHPQGGVASVQVDPDFRRHGIGQAVMQRVLEGHRERELPLSMLYPYNPPFYRRLGYATIERWIELRLRTGALTDCEEASAVHTAAPDDFNRIVTCHHRSLAGHNGGLTRPPDVWKQRVLSESRTVAVFETGQQVEGYCIYELHPTTDSLQQTLQIREWVALGGRAACALAGYIARQQAQCPETRLFVPVDSPLLALLAEPRSSVYDNPTSGRYSSGATGTASMARVIDLASAIQCGRRFVGPPLTCCFRIVESAQVIVDEAGTPPLDHVSIDFDGMQAQLTQKTPSAWFECDPGTMAQIYFGTVRPSHAAYWGVARADCANTLNRLDALFAQRAPFVHPLDYF
jgi:predicted acetyltransferase